MYLKTLTVRGFKSFASATTFEFQPGVTAVVGPNGSGKSNVVDALAWVMGEQGAKTLRGGKMEDVIFAGTSGRPALGRAQVSLTIDNTDGALPIEYSEVTITRTLFRSGGSEYAINGSPARLLDIQELLSDSGLGREMHVIVGQGQLDRILRATPEERRGFIEEAAGILKHRRRKEKTLRKLDSMQANLARLEDLTGEIAKQLRPLGKQAETARRAKTVQATVRDAKARLLADDLALLNRASVEAAEEQAQVDAEREKVQAEADRQGKLLAALETEAAELIPVAVTARDTWYGLSRLQERYKALVSLADERRRLLGTPSHDERSGDSPEELDERAVKFREEAGQANEIVFQRRQSLEDSKTLRIDAEAAQRAEDQRLTAVLRAVADRREGLARLAGQVGTARQRVESAQGERDRAETTGQSARNRAADASTDLVAAKKRAEIAAEQVKEPTSSVTQLRKDLQAKKAELQNARSGVSPLAEARAGLEARVLTLGESLPARDGTGELLKGREARIVGVLAERLKVEPGAEAAVAAGLAGAESALLAGDSELAAEIANASTQGGAGSIWVLHRDGFPAETPRHALPSSARLLSACVECEDADRNLLSVLLGNVVLVANDADAQAVVSETGMVAVTPEGHRWTETGLRIGNGDTASLERRARLEKATAELSEARLAEETARAQVKAAEPAVKDLEHKLSEVEAEAREATEASRKTSADVERLESMARQATAEADRAEDAALKAAEAVREAKAALQSLVERLEQAQAVPEESEPSTEERDRLARVAETARAEEMQARLDLSASQETARRLEERANSLAGAARRERKARQEAELRAQRRAAQAADAARVSLLASLASSKLEVSATAAQAALDGAEAQQRSLSVEIEASRAAVGRSNAEVSRLAEVGHNGQVRAAERAARIENLQDRVLDEVGMTPEYLLEHFGPHLPVPREEDPADRWAALHVEVDDDGNPVEGRPYVREEQQKRLKRAEKDLAALGKINPLALEEFAALEERHSYLSGQLADLKSSRADLLDLVRQVDEHVREVFTLAFEDTAVEFKRIFGQLFPGGEGELVLTEPGDMLTTGIDVHARPAGKKVKRLSLLSGGERSLTAIAMLVAIFTARPSPFYVMDEVEAALDERNLLRLLGVLSDLRTHSQLIIITHQKRTMDVADALYGVSMRGDGVTQVISQRLERDTP